MALSQKIQDIIKANPDFESPAIADDMLRQIADQALDECKGHRPAARELVILALIEIVGRRETRRLVAECGDNWPTIALRLFGAKQRAKKPSAH